MPVVVAKLGSAIVADEEGAVRREVLACVCEQVAEQRARGRQVVIVTSGAIAIGMRAMALPVRPAGMDELQAASAVGQGRLYREYEQRLTDAGLRSAQVLLTFFDMSARTHYLNARQTLRRLLAWDVVPVITRTTRRPPTRSRSATTTSWRRRWRSCCRPTSCCCSRIPTGSTRQTRVTLPTLS